MDPELRSRLRRLGVVKGVRNLKQAPSTIESGSSEPDPRNTDTLESGGANAQPITSLLAGMRSEQTEVGQCLVLDKVFDLSYRHGQDRLGDLLGQQPIDLAAYSGDEELGRLNFRDFLFLDTETTGLSGAGVLAFMVGVAFFERGPSSDALVVRQFFLRDHADEPAMLWLLDALASTRAGLVTFNGRAFDVPLLIDRYLMNLMPASLKELPHIDLLPLARRLWRRRLGSCALGALETRLLGVNRTQEDVPGWLIPGLYQDYLRTGDAAELLRVFYHNRIDMLSMITLTNQVMSLVAGTNSDAEAVDLLSLGKWQADIGMAAEAEQSLKQAVSADLSLEEYALALHYLGTLLKRSLRHDEALTVWQQMAAISFEDISAHVELAKYYEWHVKDFSLAMDWTRQALELVDRWATKGQAGPRREELTHRLARLQRKHSASTSPRPGEC